MTSRDRLAGATATICYGTGSFGVTKVSWLLTTNVPAVRVFSREEAQQEAMRRSVGDRQVLGEPDSEFKSLGPRHGEKLYETLLSREETVDAEDQEEYLRVPLDARSLEGERYFDQGQEAAVVDRYTSLNARHMDVAETQRLLLELPETRALLPEAVSA